MNNIKKHWIIFVVIAIVIIAGVVIGIPSLAKYKNRNTIYTVSDWDGSVATSYRKGNGTEENPYVISNGSEFAFFVKQLETTDYEGVYFELNSDIIINSGVFSYDETEGVKYTYEDEVYYLKKYTNEYYSDELREGNCVGNLNVFSSIKNFKGNLNGKSFTIYGLHIVDEAKEQIALFENLEGKITDLYVKNSLVYGDGDVAGIAINAANSSLKNVIFDGLVVNEGSAKINEVDLETFSITAVIAESTKEIILPKIEVDGTIVSIELIGEYEVYDLNPDDDIIPVNTVKINDEYIQENSFRVDLTNNMLSEIQTVVTTTVEGTVLEFKNLKYQVKYYDDLTSGLIINSANNTLKNVINKASVYGNYISSGFIVNANSNLEIKQSYNNGLIKSNYNSTGIVGEIKNNENEINIINVYNSGNVIAPMSASIIGTAIDNTAIINIKNTINYTDNYSINNVQNTTINIEKSYSKNELSVENGVTTGSFFKTLETNFYDSIFMNDLEYSSFVSLEDVLQNEKNVWIYELDSLPILYIDDLNNPIANININKYSWNNLSPELNIINIPKNIIFTIEDVSVINPIKEKYYYVTKSRVPLTELQLTNTATWTPYEDAVTIAETGYYVIYAKIVDTKDRVTYINTDVMALNVEGVITKITTEDKEWNTLKTNLEDVYFSKDINLTLQAQDNLVGFNSIEYYISNKEMTEEELKELIGWVPYVDAININQPGKYVVYAKMIDNESNVRYVNTDYLLYGGYKETLSLGSNDNVYDTNYITNKSSIKLTFESNFELDYKEGYTHNLISNMLLPVGTKITLIDKKNNNIYRKTIDTEDDLYGYNDSCNGETSCSKYATYKFETFKEVGNTNNNYYDESVNYGKVIKNEKYIIIVDFGDTNLVDNYYDLSFYMSIKAEENKKLYQTIDSTISNINIYSSINDEKIITTHNLTSNYDNQTIYYNSNSELKINFTNELTHSKINDKNVIDTNYEDKKAGLLIKLYNEAGTEISNQYLDNMIFEYSGKEYFASTNNSIKINLGSVADSSVKTLTIKTRENSSPLENGTYYLKINKFMSNDGYYYDKLYDDEISITLVVDNQIEIIPEHSFDVLMVTDSVILDKTLENDLVSFNIIYSGSFIEPNIRVSMYKKNDLTAYNQNYTLVDIAEYSNNEFVNAETNKYFIDILNPVFNLNVLPDKFDNTGYKYVFELYDGTKKISKIEKYFIVK